MSHHITRASFLILFLSATAVWGQVTISTSDLPIDFGTVISYGGSGVGYVAVDVGSPGEDQTWDFTGMSTISVGNAMWVDPTQTPQGDQFPDATHCYYMDNTPDLYYYYQTTDNNYLSIGAESNGIIFEIFNPVTPDNYPLYYTDQWMGVTESPSPFSQTSIIDTTWGVVDGWGTLVDVTGLHDCLRIQFYSKDWTMVGGVPTTPISFWQYQWLVPGGAGWVGIVSEEGETNPNFTSGRFTRVTELSGVREIPSKTALPTTITLEPAFPNPFNPQANLTFTLPVAGNVLLTIFDSQGRAVTTLHNGWLTPGRYQTQFNAVHLSSGTYYARLKSGDMHRTQKLLLVK